MFIKRLFFISLIFLGLFLFSRSSLALNNLDVVINEIAWMGTVESANSEWLELYNNTEINIDLSGWTIVAQDGTPNILLSGNINAHDYFLLERTSDDILPQITADQIYTGALGNTGEVLELRDNQNNLIDLVDFSSSWIAGDNLSKKTMARINPLLTSHISNWQNSNEVGGTPKTYNNITIPIDNSTTSGPLIINEGDLVINEFVADASDGNEWIEIYNNTTSTINLSGFILEDGAGQVAILENIIEPVGFITIELSTNKLNNDGDLIVLKYKGNIINQITYGSWDDGNLSDNAPVSHNANSTARKIDGQYSDTDSNDFSLTTTPTKNSNNLITIDTEPIILQPVTPISIGVVPPVDLFFAKSNIVINEFVSDPSDGDVEWIELYNNTSSTINLNSWSIADGSKKKTELSGLIASHQFRVIESPKGNLNNLGDLIILKDPSDNIIDQVSYGNLDDGNIFDNAPKTEDPNSLARFINGQDTDIDYNDFRISSSVTKGLPNIINSLEQKKTSELTEDVKVVTNYPKIIITEILANPLGSDMDEEFIEIYNPNDQEVDLTDWLLDDADGGSRPYKINNLVIGAKEYLSFFRKTTNLALNNDTDQVRLINPLQQISSEVEYKNIKEGWSYALSLENKWQATSVPTPSEENEMANVNTTKTTNSVAKTTKVTGTVLVEPGILGSQIFYLQEENIQVYSYKKDFPQVSVGDIVEVIGEISEGTEEKRIKTKTKNDIKIIGHKNELIPIPVLLSDIDELYLSQLVKVAGEVIEIKGSYIFIDDGTSEAKIYLKQSTGISKSFFKEGEKIELVGIVSKSGNDYRILPRYETDILRLGEVKGEEDKDITLDSSNQKYFVALIIFMGLIISWLLYRQYSYKLK